jgi:phage terminase small subunit
MVSKAIVKGKQALAEKAGVTAKKVIAEMARIGFANMQDYLDLSDPENPTIDLSKITPEQASVIAETRVERKGLQRRVTIKLHDKLNALVNLGKHLDYSKNDTSMLAQMVNLSIIEISSKSCLWNRPNGKMNSD